MEKGPPPRGLNGTNFNNILSNIYFNPRLGGSFSGLYTLYKTAKSVNKNIKLRDVKQFLANQAVYSDHKEIRRKFPRRKYVYNYVDQCWGIDLVIMEHKQMNRNFQYLLNCTDYFSKYLWIRPLKKKDADSTYEALISIIAENNGKAPDEIHW